jgi:hypothetical protein
MNETLSPFPQQGGRIDLKGVGQPLDIIDADVALAALDGADIGTIQPGEIGQGFLRKPARLPLPPQIAGKRLAEEFGGFLHRE